MSADVTLYEIRQGAAWITLNRPDARNALSADLVNSLHDHLLRAEADDQARCIVITGAGPGFCAGADLKSPPGSVVGGRRGVGLDQVMIRMQDCPKPVIAAVNGAAFDGGLGLVGASDIVVTAEEALFSFSEVRLGLVPAMISVVCLPKLGGHHAMKLFLTGERFDGARAVALGLAHRAVPRAQLAAAVQEEVDMLALGGPTALMECKKLVRRVPQLGREAAFEETAALSLRMFTADEGREGMAS
ncbi:MAG: enoyl-CoA hydratase/isomerase family protein, partial [Aquabacterium sp.]